jgi:hypothetical protein
VCVCVRTGGHACACGGGGGGMVPAKIGSSCTSYEKMCLAFKNVSESLKEGKLKCCLKCTK